MGKNAEGMGKWGGRQMRRGSATGKGLGQWIGVSKWRGDRQKRRETQYVIPPCSIVRMAQSVRRLATDGMVAGSNQWAVFFFLGILSFKSWKPM